MSDDDFEDLSPLVFAVTTATLVLATLIVFARLYTRVFIVRHVTWDDHFMQLAWLFAFAISFVIDYGTKRGLGRRDVDIRPGDWYSLRRCEYVFSVLYVGAPCLGPAGKRALTGGTESGSHGDQNIHPNILLASV